MKTILPGPMPVACRVGNGFVPVIFHPDRVPGICAVGTASPEDQSHAG